MHGDILSLLLFTCLLLVLELFVSNTSKWYTRSSLSMPASHLCIDGVDELYAQAVSESKPSADTTSISQVDGAGDDEEDDLEDAVSDSSDEEPSKNVFFCRHDKVCALADISILSN